MQPSGRRSRLDVGFGHWRLAVLAGLGAALLSALVGHALALREDDQLGLVAESAARRIRSELRGGLNARMHALSILAREWQDRFLPMRGAWESDVRLVLSQSPGLESIAWVEAAGEVSWIYPPDARFAPLDPKVLRAPAGALERPMVAGIVPASGDAPRLRILAPLIESQRHEGWLAGTYRSRELLGDILSGVDDSFAVRVSLGGTELYRGDRDVSVRRPRLSRQAELVLPGGPTLQIEVEPSDTLLAAERSLLPAVTLAGGIGMALLMTLALGLRSVAAARARALGSEIAEHQRAEEEIRRLNLELEARVEARTAELSRTNEDLKQFASFLSHELRQPVGAQVLWTDLLAAECGPLLGDQGRRYVEQIRSCTAKMADMISAQLELATVSTAELKAEPTDLHTLVSEVVSDLKVDLDEVGGVVHLHPLPAILGDPRQLRQVFRNLLDNAIKYRRPGVDLVVHIRPGASKVDPRAWIEIVVEDNGRGFCAEDAERIFRPAERLDRTGSEGHGLGLTLCRRIVARHEGELRAEGQPGLGARFRIYLPAERVIVSPTTESTSYR